MTTIEDLRRYLRDESVEEPADVGGLRFKAWISDPLGERWGAFYLFETREEADKGDKPSFSASVSRGLAEAHRCASVAKR